MEIHVIKQSENSKQACIGCKSNNIVTHGYDTRRIKDLTIAGFNSYLLYKPRRFKCKSVVKHLMKIMTLLLKTVLFRIKPKMLFALRAVRNNPQLM